MPKTHEITKYPNRRLYNPDGAKYITLEDVRTYVESGNTVRVIEKKTRRDITALVFLQIITLQEDMQERLTKEALADVIVRGPLAILDPRLAATMKEHRINGQQLIDLIVHNGRKAVA